MRTLFCNTPWITCNPLACWVTILLVPTLLMFCVEWWSNWRTIRRKRVEMRLFEHYSVVFDDRNMYEENDMNRSFLQLRTNSYWCFGNPQSFNGNFVDSFYQYEDKF